jgi:hypothetical protein
VTEEQIAVALRRKKRSVQLYLRELTAAGHVEIRKIGRRNVYLLRTLAPNREEEQAQCVAPIETERAQPVAPNKAEQAQDFAPPLRQSNNEDSSNGAAAAEQEIRKATESLVNDVGMHKESAEFLARRDAPLVLAVVAYFQIRRADAKKRPINNPIGFVRTLLKHPLENGFSRDEDGVWRPPPEFAAAEATKRAAEEKAEQRVAHARQCQREREEANHRKPCAMFAQMRAAK